MRNASEEADRQLRYPGSPTGVPTQTTPLRKRSGSSKSRERKEKAPDTGVEQWLRKTGEVNNAMRPRSEIRRGKTTIQSPRARAANEPSASGEVTRVVEYWK